MRIIFITVFVIWGLSEVAINLVLRTRVEEDKDARTFRLIWIVIASSIGLAMYLAMADDGVFVTQSRASVMGLALIVVGMIIRWWAIVTLRRYFTVNVTVREGHRLIRSGPYRFVRHPSYTGALLSFYGFALTLDNVGSAIVIVIPITFAFLIRMRVEEAVLRSAFPDEYPAYERETRRLVPFVY